MEMQGVSIIPTHIMNTAPYHDRQPFDQNDYALPDWDIPADLAAHTFHAREKHGNAARAKLLALFEMAGLLEISWEHLAHPGLDETSSRLRNASTQFTLGDGIALEEWFWTDPKDLWSQRISRQFERHKADSASCPPGFLCIYAQDASARGLFWQSASPMLSRNRLRGSFRTGGPYMALLRCEADWIGQVHVVEGYIQPILAPQVAFPVKSSLERSALAVLVTMIEKLDMRGIGMKLSRALKHDRLTDEISISLTGAAINGFTVQISCSNNRQAGQSIYHVTDKKLHDHAFLNWIAGLVQRKS